MGLPRCPSSPLAHPFPLRNLILFITFVVIFVTLVFQGFTLPFLVKLIKIKENELAGFLKRDLESDIALTSVRLESLECVDTGHDEMEVYNKILPDIYNVQRTELFKLRKEKFFSDEEIRKMEYQLDWDELKISGSNNH